MESRRALLPWLTIAAVSFATTGCFFVGSSSGPGGDPSGGNTTEQDVADYDAQQASLEGSRTQFRGKEATELAGVGTRLFWLEFPGFDPTLHSFDTATNVGIDYAFPIGSGDQYNYRASKEIVATADPQGDKIVYHVFAASEGGTSLGDLTVDAPTDEQRWWAYAADGSNLYYVTTGAETMLWRWAPGAPAAEPLFALEDAGASIGEFQDFGVDGNILIFIESGRIWSLDMTTLDATWLGNKTEATSAYWDKIGVLFGAATGPFYYAYDASSVRDVRAEIEASDYELNATFGSAHHYTTDLARRSGTVGYIGQSGLFTFDLDSQAVKPVLLNARDNSVVYRYPVLLEDGSLFVQGLESTSGATGAEGPVYRVQGSF
jgi:hypothetical protein